MGRFCVLLIFLTLSSFKPQCAFYTYNTFHFGPVTFQMLSTLIWLPYWKLQIYTMNCLISCTETYLYIYLLSYLCPLSLYFEENINNLDLSILIPVFTFRFHTLYLMAKYHFHPGFSLKYIFRGLHCQHYYY